MPSDFNKPRGQLPVLQYQPPDQLQIDDGYQRDLDNGTSRKLINAIARDWDWDQCMPLIVSRRQEGGLFVVDGQHRLCAALQRGDIQVLPCFIVECAGVEQEAALFVQLNKARKPISKLDEFAAAVAAGDQTAVGIAEELEAAGLKLAKHTNSAKWQAGEVGNIQAIQVAWRKDGRVAVAFALTAIALAFPDQQLRYAGTLFPGIVAAISDPDSDEHVLDFDYLDELVLMLAGKPQAEWRREILLRHAENAGLSPKQAAIEIVTEAWDEELGALLEPQLEAAE